MKEKKRCWGCMEMKFVGQLRCPNCGYIENTPYDPHYAPPGTELNDHYTLGIKIGHNSEGANYIGYNASLQCKVLIREYMPVNLCTRVRGRATIIINRKDNVQYKALRDEFKELNRNLAQMQNLPHIIPTRDIFEANNTVYVVYEYLEGIKLLEYLKEYGGKLTWEQVSELFPSFFTTLSLMHNHNVIHRAISPETIYITPKGELRLCGFSIYDVRTKDLALPYEIFHGYAAPEQYTAGAKQAAFTDVYGICAVLYRMLTGCQPITSSECILGKTLRSPIEINPAIPVNVSNAIMQGMERDTSKRTQTITELVMQLFEHDDNLETKPLSVSRQRTEPPKQDTNKKEHKQENASIQEQETVLERIRMPLMIAVMMLVVLLLAGLLIVHMINSGAGVTTQPSEMMTETTTENNIIIESDTENIETFTELQGDSQMPSLIGTNYEIQKERLEADGWLYLEPVYAYSDDYKAGLIMEQSIAAGETFQSGSTVKVVVSKGSSLVVLPDYTNKTLMQYEEELEVLGITSAYYHTEAVVNYAYENGQVIELNKAVGDIFDLTSSEMLKIFYVSNPETTPAIETETIVTATEAEPVTEESTEPQAVSTNGEIIDTAPFISPVIEDDTEPEENTQEAPQTAPEVFETETNAE